VHRLIAAIEAFASALGAPGLFVIAYLDSSFLSFPQANDLLVIWMVLKNKSLMPLYAGMATLGSVAGCLTLYYLAKRGGEAFLKGRVRADKVDHVMGLIRRHGMLAVIVASLLPPPAPFKLFVLLSGVAAVPWLKFALAITVGRGVRYFGQGILAVLYGDQAVDFVGRHGRELALGIAVAVAVGAAAYYFWRRFRREAPSSAL
jgi:membrane protein YqaA with SNARE-associated domain